ncbi:MAG: T9SS type A sorting domain-containing protein [Chitinophagales bacterium]|nr:T9SS type A sorting domain-containing protein [Chitinophagales bacterium]
MNCFNKFILLTVFVMFFAAGHGQQCVTATATNVTNKVCPGDTVFLSTTYFDTCFTDSILMPGYCIHHQNSTSLFYHNQIGIPTNQQGSPIERKSIYSNLYIGNRFQFLYTATELATVLDSGYITQLAWRIGVYQGTGALLNFAISLKSVPADSTELTDWQSGMSLVWGPQSYAPHTIGYTQGWSTPHVLNTPFYWDGISNLVVEVRSHGSSTGCNSSNTMSVTVDSGKVLYAMANAFVYNQQYPPTPWHEKPVMMVQMCRADTSSFLTDTTINKYWISSGNDAVQYNSNGDAFATPTTSQAYTSYVSKNGILRASNPVGINVVYTSPPTIYHNGNGMLCRGYKYGMSATGYDSYLWSTGDTTSLIYVSDTGYYSVQASKFGCNSKKSNDTVHVQFYPNQNATITLTSGSSLGTNYLAAYPDTALAYWLHRTYDTINGQIFVTYQTTSKDTLICWKDSSSFFTSNFVRYMVRNEYGCSDTTNWVELENCFTDIEDEGNKVEFSIYPNPVSDELLLTLLQPNESLKLVLTDMNMRVVLESHLSHIGHANTFRFNTASLEKGIYVAIVESGQLRGRTLVVK